MPNHSMMADEGMYRGPAKQWMMQVLLIGLIAGALNVMAVNYEGEFLPFFIFLINFIAVLISVLLLFRHVDTLILKRIAELQANEGTTTNFEG